MDYQLGRRQHQPRSNSIGGQEFHHYNPEQHQPQFHQRLKQSTHQNSYGLDPTSQYYNQRLARAGFNQNFPTNQQGLRAAPGNERSVSPSGGLLAARPTDFYVPKRSASIKYPLDRQQRHNIHASLECLNSTSYSDFSPNQKLQQHQHQLAAQLNSVRQQQQQQQQQHYHAQAFQQQQHYAASSYVMTAAPAETVVSQSAEQDLAAAAMGAPPTSQVQNHHQQQHAYPVMSTASSGAGGPVSTSMHNNYQIQSLFNNRPSLQMSQSPLHRRVSHGQGGHMMAVGGTPGPAAGNPMRAGHSSLSLASSSTYLIEDKLQNEIKQLSSELKSEKEKNEALNSQLEINSNLMAAFEQSLTTLNTRLRQMTTLNERKDREIEELRAKLEGNPQVNRDCLAAPQEELGKTSTSEKSTSPICGPSLAQMSTTFDPQKQDDKTGEEQDKRAAASPMPNDAKGLLKVIEDLKRQLIEKDRLLTDTRLEALSAAHQLEQLESRLNGEHSLLVNEDDLDEGVMVANHSPSDSDAVTDSAHFSEMNNNNNHQHHQGVTNYTKSNTSRQQQQDHLFIVGKQHQNGGGQNQRNSNNFEDMILFTPTHSVHSNTTVAANTIDNNSNHMANTSSLSNNSTDEANDMIALLHRRQQQQQHDNQSNHSSSDYHLEDKSPGDTRVSEQQQQARENFHCDNNRQAVGRATVGDRGRCVDSSSSSSASSTSSRETGTMNKLPSNMMVSSE